MVLHNECDLVEDILVEGGVEGILGEERMRSHRQADTRLRDKKQSQYQDKHLAATTTLIRATTAVTAVRGFSWHFPSSSQHKTVFETFRPLAFRQKKDKQQ